MKMTKYFAIIVLISLFSSCGKDEFEPYDHPYIHIMKDELSSTTISAKANTIGEYKIYLSSKPLTQNLKVVYSVTAGIGLQEGVDYELVNSSNELTFLPEIYDMPVRIRWKSHVVDTEADNSLIIRIESNNMDFTMGLPGDAQTQREFIITKVN